VYKSFCFFLGKQDQLPFAYFIIAHKDGFSTPQKGIQAFLDVFYDLENIKDGDDVLQNTPNCCLHFIKNTNYSFCGTCGTPLKNWKEKGIVITDHSVSEILEGLLMGEEDVIYDIVYELADPPMLLEVLADKGWSLIRPSEITGQLVDVYDVTQIPYLHSKKWKVVIN